MNQTLVGKIAANTLYQLFGKLITVLVTIVVTVSVTRHFGVQGYGEFNVMQAFPALFFIIADFGLNAIVTKALSENWDNAKSYFGNLITLRIVMSLLLIFLAALVLTAFPYSATLKTGIYLSLFLVLVQSLYASTNVIFQSQLKYHYSTAGLAAGSLVVLIFTVVFSYMKLAVMWISFSYVIGGLVTFLINIQFIRKLGLAPSLGFDRRLWISMLSQAWPIGITFVFSQINFKADSLMLSVLNLPLRYGLNNVEAVAIYGLPYKIFEVSLVIPTFFMNSVYPVYVRHLLLGKEKLLSTFWKTLAVLTGSGLLLSLVGIIFAPYAVSLLGGDGFIGSTGALRLLLLGLPIFFITQPISWLLVTLGRQKYLPIIYLAAAVFNVSANLYFIPRYSFFASSVITWLSEILILIMLSIFARKAWTSHNA